MALTPIIASRKSALSKLEPAQAPSLFRRINEQILDLSNDQQEDVNLVCECIRPGCLEAIALTVTAYEEVRRFPTRFVVKAEHVDDDCDRIVLMTSTLAVVEKMLPAEAELAILSDPRNPLVAARFRRRNETGRAH